MNFGEFSIVQIILAAFSGIGIPLVSWIFGKRYFSKIRNRKQNNEISQKDNKVNGDMAGGNIIKNSVVHSSDSNRRDCNVNQTGNQVGGDMAGSNIHKKD